MNNNLHVNSDSLAQDEDLTPLNAALVVNHNSKINRLNSNGIEWNKAACLKCRTRKRKCDGNQPCSFVSIIFRLAFTLIVEVHLKELCL